LGELETRFGSTSVWHPDQQINLSQQRLDRLYGLFERITGVFDRDELLNEVMTVCMESLRFDRGGIALWEGDQAVPQWICIRNQRPDPTGEFRISRSIVQRALHRGERILVNDVSSDLPDPTASIVSNNIRSAICVPLIYHNRVHGVLYGDRVTASAGYTKEDVDYFAALAKQAALALANVRLLEEREQRLRFEEELNLARQIQTRLLPAAPLQEDGLVIEALNDPGRRVSGDYYDYLRRPDGRVAVVCADVAGKGVPAALLMANLQAAVHVLLMETDDLAGAMAAINRLVCLNVEGGRFITGVFALLDPVGRACQFVNAGHLPPVCVFPSGELQQLVHEPDLPLGVDENFEYSIRIAKLASGPFTMFLYTDGVPDAVNQQGSDFGEGRLLDALKACAGESPGDQIASVRRLVNQFTRGEPQNDDITMVAVRLQ
jgi:sigma-B regulation protein RsbU (phosphoserine phosphatase)